MSNERNYAPLISEAALMIYSQEELQRMSEMKYGLLINALARRIKKEGAPPTQAELEGIKELVEVHLTHPDLEQ